MTMTKFLAASMFALALSVPALAQAPVAPAKGRASLSVTMTKPTLQAWASTLSANGNLAAWQEAVIGPQVGGLRIEQVLVDVGDRVRKGQLLAQLRAVDIEAEVAQVAASLQEAQSIAADAKDQAERARKIEASGTQALSAQQIAQLLSAELQTQARVKAVQAQLRSAELRLQNTRIVAADDGMISSRNATVGAIAQVGQEMFRLIRQGRVEWRAEVPGDAMKNIAVGQDVKVFALGSGPALMGKVRLVAPTVDPQTRNGLVYVSLPTNAALRPGLFVRGEFAFGSSNALSVPLSAVLQREGFAYVFRLTADNKVQQVKVELGRRLADRVEIVSGIEAAAPLVATGVAFLADGDSVNVVGSK
jgi:RND family efflux transporter MFP subunit